MTLASDKVNTIVRALWYIHDHPKEWDQGCWIAYSWEFDGQLYVEEMVSDDIRSSGSCGTVACLAGRIALQQPEFRTDLRDEFDSSLIDGSLVEYKGVPYYVSTAVFKFLLEGSTAPNDDGELLDRLFKAFNSESDLWYIAGLLSAETKVPPVGLDLEGAAERFWETYGEPDEEWL